MYLYDKHFLLMTQNICSIRVFKCSLNDWSIKIEFDQFLRGDFSIDWMRNLGIQMLTESREDLTKAPLKPSNGNMLHAINHSWKSSGRKNWKNGSVCIESIFNSKLIVYVNSMISSFWTLNFYMRSFWIKFMLIYSFIVHLFHNMYCWSAFSKMANWFHAKRMMFHLVP